MLTFWGDCDVTSGSGSPGWGSSYQRRKLLSQIMANFLPQAGWTIFLLPGLRIYTGEYKAQSPTSSPTSSPTEGRALRGPRALDSPV